MVLPLWATPERRQVLIDIALRSQGACTLCYKPPEALYLNMFLNGFLKLKLSDVLDEDGDKTKAACYYCEHHYHNDTHKLIREWQEDDRAERAEQLRLERQLLRQTPDLTGWGQRFDPIQREQFLLDRSPYYPEGFGISTLTFKRIARIRIPSAYTRLHVDLPSQKLSRNKRKKLRRAQINSDREMVDSLCQSAVDDYWQNLP
ncbi:MAG: hypothetical protein PHV74_09310 [Dehalococcoidia bacterium]|nr:hypothetical protein [Dehalococcoidia bacterium]